MALTRAKVVTTDPPRGTVRESQSALNERELVMSRVAGSPSGDR